MMVLYKCWNSFTKFGMTLKSSFFFTPAFRKVLLSKSTHTRLSVPTPYLRIPSSIIDTIKLKNGRAKLVILVFRLNEKED